MLDSLESLEKIRSVQSAEAGVIHKTLLAPQNINLPTVAIVGSMNADYTIVANRLPMPGETIKGNEIRILPGGKSGNQAVSAAKLGAHVCMFGAVGDDANADFLTGALRESGVDTTYVRHVPNCNSGATVITVDAQSGENTIVYAPGSNSQVDIDYIQSPSVKAAITSAKVLGLCLESPLESVTMCARLAHEHGVKVLLNNSPFLDTLPQDLIQSADILLVNEHEMAQLLHISEPDNCDWDSFDWQHALRAMHEFGFNEAIVTLGSRGSMVLDYADNSVHRIMAQRVDAVDTTGCGDAFMGTVLACLSADMRLVDAASLASYVSAYAATGFGAQASYGTVAQIRQFFHL
ncbi:ribokinase [Gardnerella sp. KA00603]|uniref:ribokinase n=1 Tax=Gardnerella sp. KA00603 TaxID=2749076 RepID=UPI003BA982C9